MCDHSQQREDTPTWRSHVGPPSRVSDQRRPSQQSKEAHYSVEDAPLLNHDTEQQSLFASLLHPPRKLTNLEKLLAAASIILLILMSTFVGLFASAEKHLKVEKGRHDGGGGHGGVSTTTEYATKTTTIGSAPTGKPEHVSNSRRQGSFAEEPGNLFDGRVCQALRIDLGQLEHVGRPV